MWDFTSSQRRDRRHPAMPRDCVRMRRDVFRVGPVVLAKAVIASALNILAGSGCFPG